MDRRGSPVKKNDLTESTSELMLTAAAEIDALFGVDYAKNHPAMVIAFMRTVTERERNQQLLDANRIAHACNDEQRRTNDLKVKFVARDLPMWLEYIVGNFRPQPQPAKPKRAA
jgi:hypothetical protein